MEDAPQRKSQREKHSSVESLIEQGFVFEKLITGRIKKRRENETGGSPCSRAPQLPARGKEPKPKVPVVLKPAPAPPVQPPAPAPAAPAVVPTRVSARITIRQQRRSLEQEEEEEEEEKAEEELEPEPPLPVPIKSHRPQKKKPKPVYVLPGEQAKQIKYEYRLDPMSVIFFLPDGTWTLPIACQLAEGLGVGFITPNGWEFSEIYEAWLGRLRPHKWCEQECNADKLVRAMVRDDDFRAGNPKYTPVMIVMPADGRRPDVKGYHMFLKNKWVQLCLPGARHQQQQQLACVEGTDT